MEYTGKEIYLEYKGKNLRLLNQSCPEWTHPYPYFGEPDESDATLHSAGCGIFAVMHLIDWVTGEKAEPCNWRIFPSGTAGAATTARTARRYSRLCRRTAGSRKSACTMILTAC